MALNQQSILAEYEAAKAEALKAQQGFGSQQTPSTFESQLSSAMLGREIAPNIATQERTLMKQFMTSPSEISGRLGGTVSPLQESQLVGQQRGVLMDQLNELAGMREGKRQELKDIIASTALGYKAQYEQQKDLLGAVKDKMDTAWDEYREAVRQEESRRSDSQIRKMLTYQNEIGIEKDIAQYKANRLANEPNWDHKMGAKEYMEYRDRALNEMGIDGIKWFDSKFPVFDYVANTQSNLEEMSTNKFGNISGSIDFNRAMITANETTKTQMLSEDLSSAIELITQHGKSADQVFAYVRDLNKDLFGELYNPIKSSGAGNKWQLMFLQAMQKAGIPSAVSLYNKLFGLGGLTGGTSGAIEWTSMAPQESQ